VQDIEIQQVRPPVLVGCAASGSLVVNRALAFFTHAIYSLRWLNFELRYALRCPSSQAKKTMVLFCDTSFL